MGGRLLNRARFIDCRYVQSENYAIGLTGQYTPHFNFNSILFHKYYNVNVRSRGGNWAADRLAASNPAVYQLNFVKKACEVSKTDLTDFFDQYGFFYVGQFELDDYGKYQYSMTQEMVDECKSTIKAMHLPQPKVDITTLTD